MKSGLSSLNPHAASYVPLSKRVSESDHKNGSRGGTSRNTASFSDLPHAYGAQGQYSKNTWVASDVHETETFPPSGNFAPRSYPLRGSSSQNQNQNQAGFSDKQMMEMEFEMDLAFLQMSFPGLSDESIADVYLANKGDLESSMDMLNHLEFYPFDSPEKLPETLDIGDVAESGSSTESLSLKLKNVSVDANASSST